MAPRRGAEVEQEPAPVALKFNEPLSWRAGKAIPIAELHKRLDALSTELQEMDQEETDKDSLAGVAKELAAHTLLSHKDKGVRALTACCLVDVLKLCAPDAPFTGTQLKDIFTLFVTSILPALSDPSNAYNPQHKYVLVSLAEVKSIVLIQDLPNADALLAHLFTSLFDIISGSSKSSTGEEIAKDVQYNMTQILVTLVDEAASLPSQAVDVIVAQFLRASVPGSGKLKNGEVLDEKQTTLLPKELPEAYNMAKTVCNSCPEKMGRYISQYFNEVIIDCSGPIRANVHREGAGSDDEDVATGPTESDLRELVKAHKLLRELWRVSPAVLQNVIPQLEAELSTDNVQLRLLATETLGDIISGIGAAGPPPVPFMDPAAYPPVSLEDFPLAHTSDSILTKPISPQSFAQTHAGVYHNFMGRIKDKSLIVRSGWTTAIGRILVTSAGGIGLSREEENVLVKGLGEKLEDGDEKVRLAAVKVVGTFSLRDVMTKLAPNGDVTKPGSVLFILGDRVKDRKYHVRQEAISVLGRLWGVATGEIAKGNLSVISALGGIPVRVFDAYYANDQDTQVLIDHVTYEQLLPLNYPPKKVKGAKAVNGNSQTQGNGHASFDPDKVRAERILLLLKSLEAKSKKAFFAIQGRQSQYSEVLKAFLARCEEYNGGVAAENIKDSKNKLDLVINWYTHSLPDPPRTTVDLQKYAKMHDRRSYQLLRFAMDPEKDFKTVHNSIKEFQKRINEASAAPAGLLDTLIPIVYRSSSLVYNKSHLPTILQYATGGESELQAAANELNLEISEKMPDIFKNNIKELCAILHDDVPSDTKENTPNSVETLRTLAQFAKARPADLPKDRKFIQTLVLFGIYGVPARSAKYAVNILVVATDRKEMYVKDLLEKSTTDWTYGEDHCLTKLATISELSLLEPEYTDEANDQILEITTQELLLKVRTPNKATDPAWQPISDIDEECEAKCWALQILVNRVRGISEQEKARELGGPVMKVLNTLIFKNGELSKNNDTPRHHKARLTLKAAHLMLKLCQVKTFDALLTPTAFNHLAVVAQNPQAEMRRSFIEKLQKYLVRGLLPLRFYTIIFLTAFEPEVGFRNSIMTWIRSRTKVLQALKKTTMELTLARLLSLLAHHPDYPLKPNESEDDDQTYLLELRDHGRYILYYLNTVASEENLGLIYKFAERTKQTRDGIDALQSERLYVMSDLAQGIIRNVELKNSWRMQVLPTKVNLPSGIFAPLPSHEVAQEIAETDYLPAEMEDILAAFVKNPNKKAKQKRKSDDKDEDGQPSAKKAKTSKSMPRTSVAKPKDRNAPKAKNRKSDDYSTSAAISTNRRQSGRGASSKKVYKDRDSSEDEEEMLEGVAEWEYIHENAGSSSEQAESDNEVGKYNSPETNPEPEQSPGAGAEDIPEPKPPRPNGRGGREKIAKSAKATPGKSAKSTPATKKNAARKEVVEDEGDDDDDDFGIDMEDIPPIPKPLPTKKGSAKAAGKTKTNGVGQTEEDTRPKRGGGSKSKTPPPESEDNANESPPPETPSTRRGRAKARDKSPVSEGGNDEELSDTSPPPKSASVKKTKVKALTNPVTIESLRPKRAARGAKANAKSPPPEPEEEEVAEEEVIEEIVVMEESPPPAKPTRRVSKRKSNTPIATKKVAPAKATRTTKGKGAVKSGNYAMDEDE
ncbi:armadillo-type protein [Calycina marina]|uniref:Armadillo-type protein n=1 Tax=Calycina marina TaxID=1763456 RepID=A0A9P7Z5B0_9HELO|nr:armadillo-type protein [Calycina marina]